LYADRLKAASVFLRNGFSAEGEVSLIGADLGGNLEADGAQFKNPGRYALNADSLKAVSVFLRNGFSAEGEVNLVGADLAGDLDAEDGKFKNPGKYALYAGSLRAARVILLNGFSAEGEVSLAHAMVGPLFDDEKSWPQQGNLSLDGFVYSRIGGGPTDARSRLRWLGLQAPKDNRLAIFTPQPYEQLAKVLREDGDEAGARRVLIAMENARWQYGKVGFWQRCWGLILWATIRYGYEPFWAVFYIVLLVILGGLLFSWGHEAGVVAQTDQDKPDRYRPFNSLIYSLETFLPIVDLGQAKHWAPSPNVCQSRPWVTLFPFKPLSRYRRQFGPAFGKHLRWYLWGHILMGWFFTLMLVAAFSGLVQKG
jgi:sRNA-binding regulator protein Hfq